jgi:hypothetical protein
MPLTYTGDKSETMNGTLYRATGNQDETIIVQASHEVLQDKEEEAVLQKASDKYDAGHVEKGKVTVRDSDFTLPPIGSASSA